MNNRRESKPPLAVELGGQEPTGTGAKMQKITGKKGSC